MPKLTDGRVQISVQPKTRKRKEPSFARLAENRIRTPADLLPTRDGVLPPQYQDLSINPSKPSKHRKSSRGDKSTHSLFIPWEPQDVTELGDVTEPECVTIQNVQDSYSKAMKAGQLRSASLPHLKPADHPPTKRWDPYLLSKEWLSSALLNEEKLGTLRKQLDSNLGAVPKVTGWSTQIEKCKLTPTNLREILLIAFGFMEVHQIRQPAAGGEMPYALMMASFLLARADNLEAQQTSSRQAMTVARIVGYALMRVCEVDETLTHSQVSMICMFQKYFANVKRSVII